ncbi:MAG TPA: discoidin domain-containing protein [Thermomicrobiales bacterium]|nr:discoidin domain-containing protein [Thermomicrobiales bacterium]
MSQVASRLLVLILILACLIERGVMPKPVRAASFDCSSANEVLMLDRINTFRSLQGTGSVQLSPTLTLAARHQAESMARYDYFPTDYSVQFEGPNQDQTITWQQNIANAGYPDNTHTARAAIIGTGTPNVTAIAAQVFALPAYETVLLDARYLAIGIGFAASPTDPNLAYWTITFGSLVDAVAKPCAGVPTAIPIARAEASTNSLAADLATDGDLHTVWHSTEKSPYSIWLGIDLGSVQSITRIEWLLTEPGGADEFTILVSTDGRAWSVVASKSNGAVDAWRSVEYVGRARYIQYTFGNPNKDAEIGYLAEVRVLD